MAQLPDPLRTLRPFRDGFIYSLKALESQGFPNLRRLPTSLRIVLESVLRNCDERRVRAADVRTLATWQASRPAGAEIPFVVARIILQDFTGVPLLVDLAAMREAVDRLGKNPDLIEPLVPVDLVVDHSVQVDRAGTAQAFAQNLAIEFDRNLERYEFLKWGQQAFQTFRVIPPAVGIVHQVNLEYLARVVFRQATPAGVLYYPDTLVGTDSHTTMINGLGVVGWGVGGIEAEAGMLGQPVYFLTPEVVGVNLIGQLRPGVTATDLTLKVTELLRRAKVVGKFVEFFGTGAAALSLADRATIANMAPEYGATMGYFPVDERTIDYLRMTGRTEDQLNLIREYLMAQDLWGIPMPGAIDYSQTIDVDLAAIQPCVAGPKRPQDRIDLPDLPSRFAHLLKSDVKSGGYGLTESEAAGRTVPVNNDSHGIRHGSVVIAAITSCTNTSNPNVMVAAGLLARKAIERGLRVNPAIKTSLAPGSRVVTDYLEEAGLQTYLDQLGFQLVGYGCTTCIGNSGPLPVELEEEILKTNAVVASVLSGNRNFEARVHGAVKANFLMSPPLVVAFALAGRIDLDLTREPLGRDLQGRPVFLSELWPTPEEIQETVHRCLKPEMFLRRYADVAAANPRWLAVAAPTGSRFDWRESSTYIQHPPFFDNFQTVPNPLQPLTGMRPLALLGDSVTTDHISPAGQIAASSPAGRFLREMGVSADDFNSYGARRGNDRIMTRGTFANVWIKNAMADGREGGITRLMPEGRIVDIYEAALAYRERKTPSIVFAGADYGMGSSRDWAAKGTRLLGVRAVVAVSYERIHRSNLVGMGVLPLQFPEGVTWAKLGLNGAEVFHLPDLNDSLHPRQTMRLHWDNPDGSCQHVDLSVRIDTPIEVEYYRHGGILPYVLNQILQA